MRECINCKYGVGVGSDVWCGHEPQGKESYMHNTDCPYFERVIYNESKFNDITMKISKEKNNLREENYEMAKKIAKLLNEKRELNKKIVDKEIQLDFLKTENQYMDTILQENKVLKTELKNYVDENSRLEARNQRLREKIERERYSGQKQFERWDEQVNQIIDELTENVINVIDRKIKNNNSNPPKHCYYKVARALNDVREELENVIGDLDDKRT